jgi:hypothetical protein
VQRSDLENTLDFPPPLLDNPQPEVELRQLVSVP